jgi:hypothetical protein
MQKIRVSVPLDNSEADALISMARAACRHPREQLRFLLRQEARRLGLVAQQTEDELLQRQNNAERLEGVSGGQTTISS